MGRVFHPFQNRGTIAKVPAPVYDAVLVDGSGVEKPGEPPGTLGVKGKSRIDGRVNNLLADVIDRASIDGRQVYIIKIIRHRVVDDDGLR